MEIDHKSTAVKRVVNEQFKIIGLKRTFEDIPEETLVGKKKVKWYDLYKFENEEQYIKWKTWARGVLEEAELANELDMIDMIWGLGYKWEEEGKNPPLLLF